MAFDLRTSTLNKKGQKVSENPYTLYVENGVRVYERGGDFFYENGEKAKPEHIPASAPKKADVSPTAEERAETRAAIRSVNKKIKEHDKSEGADRNTPPVLAESEQDALDTLLNEDV